MNNAQKLFLLKKHSELYNEQLSDGIGVPEVKSIKQTFLMVFLFWFCKIIVLA